MGEIFSNQKGRTIYNRQQYILNRERKRRLTWITPRRPTRYYHHQVLFGDGITTATAYILYRWLCMYVCGCESEKSAQKRKENDSEGRAIWISVRCGYGSGPEVYIYIAPPFSLFYILQLLLLRDLSIKTYTFFLFFLIVEFFSISSFFSICIASRYGLLSSPFYMIIECVAGFPQYISPTHPRLLSPKNCAIHSSFYY